MAYTKAAHHRGTFQRAGDKVKARAYADATTVCPRCGLTLDQARQRWGRYIKWEAGHVNAGERDGELRAEHNRCNRSHGATLGNRQRRLKRPRPTLKVSRPW